MPRKKLTQQAVLLKCKEINPNYDYSEMIYTGSKDKIKIGCSVHGWFLIRYDSFIRKSGCSKCFHKEHKINMSLTQQEAIQKCKNIWGNRYDYSKMIYTGSNEQIKVLCKIHGVFSIRYSHHINNCGCKNRLFY